MPEMLAKIESGEVIGSVLQDAATQGMTPGNAFVIFFISRIYLFTPSIRFLSSVFYFSENNKLPQKPPPCRNSLFGIYALDQGEIILDNEKVNFSGPAEALRNHISMVHQELNQVLDRSVMENVWLGRFPMKRGLVNHKKMYDDTKKIFDEFEINVDPSVKTGKLQVAQRQMIEIAKAVSYDAKVIVMDEPTSSLTENEVEHLFKIINKLRSNGVSII